MEVHEEIDLKKLTCVNTLRFGDISITTKKKHRELMPNLTKNRKVILRVFVARLEEVHEDS